VIILRLRKWQSPFKADRNHLHHQFLNIGFSHGKTVIVLVMINLFFIGLAWWLRNQSDTLILPSIIVLCLAINFFVKKAQKVIL
jgi:UDP-N-acetylmuramyl pentapeptide phosphotransferase/UDP-N-acetylglucosamine-1-phosphate transferase